MIALLVLFQSLHAQAYSSFNSSSMEWNRLLSVGQGIVAPSYMTSVFENPAGLVYNTNFKFVGSASTNDTSGFRPVGIGAQIYAGSGRVGGTVGAMTSVNNSNGAAFGSSITMPLGIAASLGSVALGVGGSAVISGSGFFVASSTFNIGMIASINHSTSWGLLAYNVLGGGGFGTGFSYSVSNEATLVVDAAVNRTMRGAALKPGIVANIKPIQLALSYGLRIDNSSTSAIATGLSAGFGWESGQSTHWQFYYNELSTLYLALTVRI